jgi:hypothetical protein
MAISPKPSIKFVPQFTVINFDDVSDGTAIDNQYQNLGVKFASVTDKPPAQWHAFARKTTDAQTQPNVVSVNQTGDPSFDANAGGIEATFVTPQRYACINARPVIIEGPENPFRDIGRPYIESLDAQGNFLDVMYYPIAFGQMGYGDYRPLFVQSASPLIGKVRFSCHPSGYHNAPIYGLFDRFAFTDQIVRIVQSLPLGSG